MAPWGGGCAASWVKLLMPVALPLVPLLRERESRLTSPLTPTVYETRSTGRDDGGVPCCSRLFKHTNSHSGRYRSTLSLEVYRSVRKRSMSVLASSISGKQTNFPRSRRHPCLP